MNTSETGREFEKEILAFFDQLIRNGDFMVIPDGCRLYHQKGYYSRERESDIIFDIAIEVCRPKEENFSFRFIIECKKYQHPVPVSDIEEFHNKVRQVGSANTKAIMVASSAFQEGGLKYAQANGIGLIRYFSTDNLKWILNRAPSAHSPSKKSSRLDVINGLTNPHHKSPYYDLYACVGETYTHTISDFLLGIREKRWGSLRKIKLKNKKNGRVNYLSPQEIENRAEEVLIDLGYKGGRVSLNSILDRERATHGLQFSQEERGPSSEHREILGEISFSPLKITLYGENPEQSVRQRFTLAHELGHYFLDHGRYLIGERRDYQDDPENVVQQSSFHDIRRLEWQANYFAACLLLPRQNLTHDFLVEILRLEIVDRGYGPLYVDHQRCNQENFYRITSTLRWDYGVSRSVLRIRLLGLGLLKENYYWRSLEKHASTYQQVNRHAHRAPPTNINQPRIDFRLLAKSLYEPPT